MNITTQDLIKAVDAENLDSLSPDAQVAIERLITRCKAMDGALQRFNYLGQAMQHDQTELRHTGDDVYHVQQALFA